MPTAPGGAVIGGLLVGLQFSLLGLLLWAVVRGPGGSPYALGAIVVGLLLAASVALGLWAVSANRPGNFNIRPVPKSGGQLVTAGPYRWIRHPMYTSLLLLGLACCLQAQQFMAWLSLALLLAVLLAKSLIEERAMVQVHPSYREYQQSTHRFIPWIF